MAKQKNREQNGIHFGESIRILSVEKKANSAIWLAFQLLLIVTGVWSAIFCFTESVSLSFHKGVVMGGIFLFSLYFFLLLHFAKKRRLILILSIACFVAISIYFFRELLNGFFYVEEAYLEMLNRYMGISLYGPTPKMDEILCTNYFLLLISFWLSFFLSLAIIKGSFRGVYLMISLFFVSLGFFIGRMPPDLPFLLYIIQLMVFYVMELMPIHITKKMVPEMEEKKTSENRFIYLLRIKIGCFCAALLLCMFLIVRLIITPDFYETVFHNRIQPFKNQIQTSLMEISTNNIWKHLDRFLERFDLSEGNFLGYSWGRESSGELRGGSLSKAGKVEFNNITVLSAKVPNYGKNVYLKGYAGSNYTGVDWEGLSSKEKAEYQEIVDKYGNNDWNALNQTAKLMELFRTDTLIGMKHILSSVRQAPIFRELNHDITYQGANQNYLYSPYPIKENYLNELEQTDDLFVRPKSSDDFYELQFYDVENNYIMDFTNYFGTEDLSNVLGVLDQEKWEEYCAFEQEYRKFVYDVYTKLPEKGLERIRSLKITEEENVFHKAEAVISYLEQHTNYTLEPGELPDGEDFVEYFLFDNHKGYCAHYASSAVLLLRNLGVPARYVEGYLITKQDIEKGVSSESGDANAYYAVGKIQNEELLYHEVEVKDSSAHAWVEIYLDGYGWYPIEVTSGYRDIASLLRPTPIEEEAKQKLTEAPKPTAAPRITKSPMPSVPAPTKETVPGSNNQTEDNYSAFPFIFLISIFLLIMVFFLVRRNIIRNRRRKLKAEPSISHRIMLQYAQLDKLLKHLGIRYSQKNSYEAFAIEAEELIRNRFEQYETSFPEVMNIVLKARFSYVEMLEEDFDIIEKYSEWLRSKILLEEGFLKSWHLR